MTREDAQRKSQELFGSRGKIFDRQGVEGDGIDWGNIPRYYVGNGSSCGNGDTWEAAFDNLPKHVLAEHQQSLALKDKL